VFLGVVTLTLALSWALWHAASSPPSSQALSSQAIMPIDVTAHTLRAAAAPAPTRHALQRVEDDDPDFETPPPQKTMIGPPTNREVDGLIDRFGQISEPGPGFDIFAGLEGSLGDTMPRFVGSDLVQLRGAGTPALREIVSRGVSAIPDLLNRLLDARQTDLVAGESQFYTGKWFGHEYDPRYRDPARCPSGVDENVGVGIQNFRTYSLRIGDLCYVALGQIVNRDLLAVRYQPTACLVINSPVETPSLALAARKDWKNLTVEQHKASLRQDAFEHDPFVSSAAVTRMFGYYPDEGEALALKLLRRPIYLSTPVRSFIERQLMREPQPARWRPLISEFERHYGAPAARSIPQWIYWIYWKTEAGRDPHERRRARALLQQLYPDYDVYAPHFIDAVSLDFEADFIDGLLSVRSRAVGAAIYNAFLAAPKQLATVEERMALDDFAIACAERLRLRRNRPALQQYLLQRIKALDKLPTSTLERSNLRDLQAWAGTYGVPEWMTTREPK
jgi:hypothetical protein